MPEISRESLRSVSYLAVDSIGDRTVNSMPLWDGQRWHLWIPGPNGLVDMKPADVSDVSYVATKMAHADDIFVPFVEFMWQRSSWPEVCPLISGIIEDIHNMGTSVAKLRTLHDLRGMFDRGLASRFAATECEYMLVLARTVFDMLQEIISRIWQKRVRLKDEQAEQRRKSRTLPDTFSKLVMHEKKALKTAVEIEKQYGLPLFIASEYAKHAPFFAALREMRDRIVHSGSNVGLIFVTERGFCVDPTAKPFDAFKGWQPTHRFNDNLVSIFPWLAYIVNGTLGACTELMRAMASAIQFPPEIAPGYHVYVRAPTTKHLFELLQIMEGGDPWLGTVKPG